MYQFLKFIFGIKLYRIRTFRPDPARNLSAKPVWHIALLCLQCRTPDDGQRNCPKHVEFYSKNKFEKVVHLVGSIIRIYRDARSPERQNPSLYLHTWQVTPSLECRAMLSLSAIRFWIHVKLVSHYNIWKRR